MRHARYECGKYATWQCDYCQTKFKRRDNKLKHMKSYHLQEYESHKQ